MNQWNLSKRKTNLIREIQNTWPIILCLRTFSLSRILIATFSPVSTFRANLTLAKLPSPSVRPSSYFPTRVLLLLFDRDAIFSLSLSLSVALWNWIESNRCFSVSRANGSRPLLLARLPYLRLRQPHFFFFLLKKEKREKVI